MSVQIKKNGVWEAVAGNAVEDRFSQIEIKDVTLTTDTRVEIAAGGEGNVYSVTYTLAQGEKVVGITNLDAGNGWGAAEVSFKFFGIDTVSDGVIRLRATVKNLSNSAKSIGCSGHITTIKGVIHVSE